MQITYEAHLSWPTHGHLGDKWYRRLEGWDVALPLWSATGWEWIILKDKVGKYFRRRVRSRRRVGTEYSPIYPGDKRVIEGKTSINKISVCSLGPHTEVESFPGRGSPGSSPFAEAPRPPGLKGGGSELCAFTTRFVFFKNRKCSEMEKEKTQNNQCFSINS